MKKNQKTEEKIFAKHINISQPRVPKQQFLSILNFAYEEMPAEVHNAILDISFPYVNNRNVALDLEKEKEREVKND